MSHTIRLGLTKLTDKAQARRDFQNIVEYQTTHEGETHEDATDIAWGIICDWYSDPLGGAV